MARAFPARTRSPARARCQRPRSLAVERMPPAANGSDMGCFEVDLAKWGPAVNELGKRVLMAKGKADKKDAEATAVAMRNFLQVG